MHFDAKSLINLQILQNRTYDREIAKVMDCIPVKKKEYSVMLQAYKRVTSAEYRNRYW